MRRRVRLLVSIPILLGLLTMGPAAAASDDGQPPLGRPVYLALGDSVAAGVGASDPAVTGYVPRLYDLLRDEPSCQLLGRAGCRSLALDDLAVGGATSTTLLTDQLPVARTSCAPTTGTATRETMCWWSPSTLAATTCSVWCRPARLVRTPSASGAGPGAIGEFRGQLQPDPEPTAGCVRSRHTVIVAMTYYNPLGSCCSGLRWRPWPMSCWRVVRGLRGSTTGSAGFRLPTACWWPTPSVCLVRGIWLVEPIVCIPTTPAT